VLLENVQVAQVFQELSNQEVQLRLIIFEHLTKGVLCRIE